MNEELTDLLAPEVSAAIYECSGARMEPEAAAVLWPRILQHKWVMSEKLGRDVGLRVACIDFLENMEENGERKGPLTQDQMVDKINARKLLCGTLIWKSGFDQWRKVEETEFKSYITVLPPLPSKQVEESRSKMNVQFKNPKTGEVKSVKVGWSKIVKIAKAMWGIITWIMP